LAEVVFARKSIKAVHGDGDIEVIYQNRKEVQLSAAVMVMRIRSGKINILQT